MSAEKTAITCPKCSAGIASESGRLLGTCPACGHVFASGPGMGLKIAGFCVLGVGVLAVVGALARGFTAESRETIERRGQVQAAQQQLAHGLADIEKFKGHDLFGHVTLERSLRSPLAEAAATML